MLTTEVYYHKPDYGRQGRWWFAVLKTGRLGQAVDCLVRGCCRDKKDAARRAADALREERGKHAAA